MENDHKSNHSEKSYMGSILTDEASGTISSDGYLSYFKDDEARAWERSLFAADMGLDLNDRKEQKEARDLLWRSGVSTVVSSVPLPKLTDRQTSGSSGIDEDVKPAPGTGQKSADRSDASSGQRNTGRSASRSSSRSTGRSTNSSAGYASSHASGRISSMNSAWDILSGNQTAGYNAASYGTAGYKSSANKTAGYNAAANKTAARKTASRKTTGSGNANRSGFIAKTRRAEAASRARIKRDAVRKNNSVPILVLMITIILTFLTIASAFFFIRHFSSGTDSNEPAGQDIFIGIDDDKDESGGNDILTEFGYDYSDFYSSKYIASYEDPGKGGKYQELCAINPEAFFGTPSRPVSSSKKLYYSDVQPTWITLGYVNTDSYLNCGYTIMYADPEDSNSYGIPDNMYPPSLADPGEFFEAVARCYIDPESYYQDNYKDCRIEKMQNASIGEHDLLYMEVTYKDSVGREVLDVYSFEQKPQGTAFIAECRSEKGEVKNGEEALSNLYSMLTFQTDSFGFIDASRFRFTQARVYNSGNSHSATIDVSDLGDLKYSRIYYKDLVNFQIGEYGNYGDPELQITMDYIAYCSVDDLGGYEKWIDYTLEKENERGDYVEPARETDRGQFTYEGNTVYFLSMAGSEKLMSSTEDVSLYMYRIETQDSEVTLDMRFEHNVPESWDPEGFLKDHVIVENIR